MVSRAAFETMQSRHVEMTFDAFQRLPREAGWKYEYFGGKAHVTPWTVLVPVALRLSPRPVPDGFRGIGPATPDAAPALVDAFVDAFEATIEYCDWPHALVRRSAEELIRGFFAGERGDPLAETRIAREGERIAAAALLVRARGGPHLDLLLVRGDSRRRGLATALVASAANALLARGETTLTSRYHAGNVESAAWHGRFGFMEQPSIGVAAMRRRLAQDELRRRELAGDLGDEERARLASDVARWEQTADRLERGEKEKLRLLLGDLARRRSKEAPF